MVTRALLLLQTGSVLAGAMLVLGTGVSDQPPAVHAVAETALRHPGAVVPTAAPAVVVHLTSPKAAARPAPARKASSPARRTLRPPPRRAAVRSAAVRLPPLTARQRLDRAVARIPSYPGGASWILTTQYGSWGTADWYHDRVYISPTVPSARIYDVVAHEWSHLLSVRGYGGDVDTAVAAMNRWYGGSGLTGAERAADCMARHLGARWTRYTSCQDAHWQDGARRLIAGRPLEGQ